MEEEILELNYNRPKLKTVTGRTILESGMFATQLVNVQPMKQPKGSTYYFQCTYSSGKGNQDGK